MAYDHTLHQKIKGTCALCDTLIYQHTNSAEHIIPNAIGGRRKVFSFICRECNSRYGHTSDAALALELRPLSLLLGIQRQNGTVPNQDFETIAGKKVRLSVDGTMSYVGMKSEIIEKDGNTYLSLGSESQKQARLHLKGLKRKMPNLDVEGILKQFRVTQTYSNDPIKMSFTMDGAQIGRS